MVLGEKIRARLATQGIKHAEFARALGMTPQAVNGWFRTSRVDKKHLGPIADYLGVGVEWLLDGQPASVEPVSEERTIRFERLNVTASAGPDYINSDFPETVRMIELSESAALRLVGKRGIKAGKIISVNGDSMVPTIAPSDLLFIDPTVESFEGDGIYLFVYDGSLHLKRLQQRARGNIAVISDNENYQEWLIERDDPTPWHVVARVLKCLPMNAKDFA